MPSHTRAEILQLFRDTGVLLDGHFLLTSGKHSPTFLQCSQVMQYPEHAGELAAQLARHFDDLEIDSVVGPAMGGVVLAYEMARQLGVRALFAEKQDSDMVFRRGFHLKPGERVLVVEDAVSTGGSVRKVMNAVREAGAEVVGVAILVDRTSGAVDFGVTQHALVELEIPSYSTDECPMCQEGMPLTSPKDV